MLRGMIRPGFQVSKGFKIGDVDPRGELSYLCSIGDKPRALGGAVLQAIAARFKPWSHGQAWPADGAATNRRMAGL